MKKSTHQAWSTRWSGEFSGASRHEASKMRNIKEHWKAAAEKALTYNKMKKAAFAMAISNDSHAAPTRAPQKSRKK